MRKRICLISLMVVLSLVEVNAWSAPFAYITNNLSNSVSIIDTATNTVIGTPIPVGTSPFGVAVNPAGTRVYVVNTGSNSVSVIDTATNTVTGTPIPVGSAPRGVAVNPAGTRVYVANSGSNTVSVIDAATNTVIGEPIPVGQHPNAFGQFIGPTPAAVWAGTVSFSARINFVETDSSGNQKFVASNETFAGTMSLYLGESGPTKSAEGCYLKFLGNDGTAIICINDIAAISTESIKSGSEKSLLIGSGNFTTSFGGKQVTGMAYIDAQGTLKEDKSNNLISIGLRGKIAGGVNGEFVLSGNFNVTLTK